MPIVDLFSKRQKRLKGEIPDVFKYDEIPKPLRVQIVHIMHDAIGEDRDYSYEVNDFYKNLHSILCREYGLFSLIDYGGYAPPVDREIVEKYFLGVPSVEKVLDIVELTFKYISELSERYLRFKDTTTTKLHPKNAIEELNQRFKEHGIGYQFDGGTIIRMDSTYIHSEITKPTIALLLNKKFSGANEEYFKAHEHYKHGRNKECLTECAKAFESTIKIICTEKGWPFDHHKDTAMKLVNICFNNGLIPTFTQNQFTSLVNLLTSGIPTIRNKVGGHGQGQVPQKVDDEITRYGLNLTGSNIIFLIEQSGIK